MCVHVLFLLLKFLHTLAAYCGISSRNYVSNRFGIHKFSKRFRSIGIDSPVHLKINAPAFVIRHQYERCSTARYFWNIDRPKNFPLVNETVWLFVRRWCWWFWIYLKHFLQLDKFASNSSTNRCHCAIRSIEMIQSNNHLILDQILLLSNRVWVTVHPFYTQNHCDLNLLFALFDDFE